MTVIRKITLPTKKRHTSPTPQYGAIHLSNEEVHLLHLPGRDLRKYPLLA